MKTYIFSQRQRPYCRCIWDNSCFLCNHCTATSNTHAHRVGEKERRTDTAALLQGSGFWLMMCLLPVGLHAVSICCTCLTQRPRGPVLLIWFQCESVFEAQRRNPRTWLYLFYVFQIWTTNSAAAAASNWGIHPHLLQWFGMLSFYCMTHYMYKNKTI